MTLILANIWGFIYANWRILALIAGIGLFIIGSGMVWRACKPKASINEQSILKAEEAIAERNDAKLREALIEIAVEEKQIDANVANAKRDTVNAATEARKKYEDMSIEDLQKEFEGKK